MTFVSACGGSSGDNGGSYKNIAPNAAITSPTDGDAYTYGDTIIFMGSGADTEDGDLSGASLVWTSDIDGALGTGTSITLNDLSPGDHIITLTVTDSNAETGSDSIYISVKAWTHPESLTDNISPGGQEAESPQVAMDGSGNAVITWTQYDSSYYQIFKSEYRDGGWTHPESLADNISPDGQFTYPPKVAMDGNGNAVITWHQQGSNIQIFMSEYRDGAWTHPESSTDNISPDGGSAFLPEVAMDGNDNAVITWMQDDGSDDQIFISEYRDGGWTHPESPTDNISPDGQGAYNPQVAMDGDGNAIITWEQHDGSNLQIFKSEYRNGYWTHPESLTNNISPDGRSAHSPQVAMGGSGSAIITWYQSDGSNSLIFKSEYRDGAWTHPESLSDNISPDGGSAISPQVAMDGNGNAVITWYQSDGSNDQIFMSEYRDGSWTHPESLIDNISPDGQDAGSPQVAMDENGNAVVTWMQDDGSNIQIFKSEYRNGSWTHPESLTDNISPDGQDAYIPQVAMNGNGNAIITWEQYDGNDEQIFMSTYH